MAYLSLINVNKIFANGVHAVHDFNLEIEKGEFVIFVGPSGCGKSTTLRMIIGLEDITSGKLYLEDKLINDTAPVDRNFAMVFQNYALYSHMTVYENIGISLKVRHRKSDEIHHKVMKASDILETTPYLNRVPKLLSGGEKQRVALGRTIVRDPKLFLMDEPLSNLDAKLREQTRGELKKLHKKLNATIVYVTHDQVEAMTMATRIVVMRNGYIEQVGTPFQVYNFPNNVFVGSFIGTPAMNFIRGKLAGEYFFFEDKKIRVPHSKLNVLKAYENKNIILGIRPENIKYIKETDPTKYEDQIELPITHLDLLGSVYNARVKINNNEFITCIVSYEEDIKMGQKIKLIINMEKCHFFDYDTELRIREVD